MRWRTGIRRTCCSSVIWRSFLFGRRFPTGGNQMCYLICITLTSMTQTPSSAAGIRTVHNRFGETDDDGNDLTRLIYTPMFMSVGSPAPTLRRLPLLWTKSLPTKPRRSTKSGSNALCLPVATPSLRHGRSTECLRRRNHECESRTGNSWFWDNVLWTSKHNLHPSSFNKAINQGAGFVTYAGHGFEHGWGPYRPNAVTNQLIFYYTPIYQGLNNGNKLPVISLMHV